MKNSIQSPNLRLHDPIANVTLAFGLKLMMSTSIMNVDEQDAGAGSGATVIDVTDTHTGTPLKARFGHAFNPEPETRRVSQSPTRGHLSDAAVVSAGYPSLGTSKPDHSNANFTRGGRPES